MAFCLVLCRGGDPGAKVVSDGGPPTTREGRLLSWAGEIEAQVSAQKAELRRARMELVSAQEVRIAVLNIYIGITPNPT
jgi:hypothetical protein